MNEEFDHLHPVAQINLHRLIKIIADEVFTPGCLAATLQEIRKIHAISSARKHGAADIHIGAILLEHSPEATRQQQLDNIRQVYLPGISNQDVLNLANAFNLETPALPARMQTIARGGIFEDRILAPALPALPRE